MRKYLSLFFISLIFLSVTVVVYHFLSQPFSTDDINLINRGIDTPWRLWLNGYLGVFFGFKFLGTTNWILVFLLIYYFLKKKMEKWQGAFLLFYFITLLIVIVKGFFNTRYQITLLPFTIAMVLFLLWEYLENEKLMRLRFSVFSLLLGMAFFNDFYFYYKKPFQIKEAEDIWKEAEKSNITANTLDYSTWLHPLPAAVIDYINTTETNGMKYLVNNVPFFYYYTNRFGIYYWCQNDVYYSTDGERKLFDRYKDSSLSSFLLDSLHCKYILTAKAYFGYSKRFDTYVGRYCKPVIFEKGIELYEVLPIRN